MTTQNSQYGIFKNAATGLELKGTAFASTADIKTKIIKRCESKDCNLVEVGVQLGGTIGSTTGTFKLQVLAAVDPTLTDDNQALVDHAEAGTLSLSSSVTSGMLRASLGFPYFRVVAAGGGSGSSATVTIIYGQSKSTNAFVKQSATDFSGSTLTTTGNAAVGGTLGVTGAATFSAATTIGNKLIATPQALSGAGAVNLTTLTTHFTSTGASQALTLADGTAGQVKIIAHVVDGGSGVLTPTHLNGGTTITFTNVGDMAILVFDGTAWNAVVRGATLA